MDPGAARGRRPGTAEAARIAEIVPARAVLTELARGFLMVQAGDPERAKQFASSFLKEQVGRQGPGRIVPASRRPTVRRGVGPVGSDGYSISSGFSDDPSAPSL